MFRSTSLRLAAIYTALFAASVVILAAVIFLMTQKVLADQFDSRLSVEAAALAQEFRTEGLDGLIQAVRERDHTPGALDYGLIGPGGRPMAGILSSARVPKGWSVLNVHEADEGPERLRILATDLPGGYRLLTGDDLARIEAVNNAVLAAFAWALGGVLLLGAAAGYGLSRGVHRQLSAISGTAEAIIDGDLSRRVPVRGSDDDLDRLAATFNRMLDRIGVLMESLKQVSNDIAHDLRTPLSRLRQRLEAGLAGRDGATGPEALQSAIQDVDAIMETFTALLRIAQIEGGARRAGFRATDLAEIARTVVDAFAPSAEEGRQTLLLKAGPPRIVIGDPELLTQMLVNLVDNALRHCPDGAHIRVGLNGDEANAPTLWVSDDGPGVPAAERDRLFDRFYRLEASRTSPGSGLGLTLVAAIARLHEAAVEMSDAEPGLRVRVRFPQISGVG